MTVRDSIRSIQDKARLYNFTKAELARRANLHRDTLSNMFDEDWSPNTRTVEALERVLWRHERQ